MGDNDSGYDESAAGETNIMMYNVQLPDGTAFLDTQLAGHCFDLEKNKIGEYYLFFFFKALLLRFFNL